jgi:hypothetical protein
MDKFKVTLLPEERQGLEALIHKGKGAARVLMHARILLATDESEGRPARTDATVAEALNTSERTVQRVRQRFVCESFEAAVYPKPPPPRPEKIKINAAAEAKLIELACSEPPDGHCTWTLQMLADQLVVLRCVESVGRESVRKSLKKTISNLVS